MVGFLVDNETMFAAADLCVSCDFLSIKLLWLVPAAKSLDFNFWEARMALVNFWFGAAPHQPVYFKTITRWWQCNDYQLQRP